MDADARASGDGQRFNQDHTIGDKFEWKNATKLRNVDQMRFPQAGRMGKPLQLDLPPLNLTTESVGTQGTTTPTPKTTTPTLENEETPKVNELRQDGWGGPAEPNPSLKDRSTSGLAKGATG